MWDLVLWPGIKPRSPALGAQNLSHWTTREVPRDLFLKSSFDSFILICWQIRSDYWALPSEYVQCLSTSDFHCFCLGQRHQYLSPGLCHFPSSILTLLHLSFIVKNHIPAQSPSLISCYTQYKPHSLTMAFRTQPVRIQAAIPRSSPLLHSLSLFTSATGLPATLQMCRAYSCLGASTLAGPSSWKVLSQYIFSFHTPIKPSLRWFQRFSHDSKRGATISHYLI